MPHRQGRIPRRDSFQGLFPCVAVPLPVLEIEQCVKSRFKLLIVCNHSCSSTISTIPLLAIALDLPSGNSLLLPAKGARRRTQNTLAPKCACADAWSKRTRASPVSCAISNVFSISRKTSTFSRVSIAVTNDPNHEARHFARSHGDLWIRSSRCPTAIRCRYPFETAEFSRSM